MKYYNTDTQETYNSYEEMIDNVHCEIDDIMLLCDMLNTYPPEDIWNMLTDDAKYIIIDACIKDYICEHIEKIKK